MKVGIIMKKKFMIVIVFLIFIAFAIYIVTNPNNKENNDGSNKLDYRILYKGNTNTEKDYVIYSDGTFDYTIKENPENIYILLANNRKISADDLIEAKKNLNNNNYSFINDNNLLNIYNIEYAIYSHNVSINQIIDSSQLKIKKKTNSINFDLSDTKIDQSTISDKKLYYEDKNGIKLYVVKINSIKVKNNGSYEELSDILSSKNSATDNVYAAMSKITNSVCSGIEPGNITGYCDYSLRVDVHYENNELYYILYPFSISNGNYEPDKVSPNR